MTFILSFDVKYVHLVKRAENYVTKWEIFTHSVVSPRIVKALPP